MSKPRQILSALVSLSLVIELLPTVPITAYATDEVGEASAEAVASPSEGASDAGLQESDAAQNGSLTNSDESPQTVGESQEGQVEEWPQTSENEQPVDQPTEDAAVIDEVATPDEETPVVESEEAGVGEDSASAPVDETTDATTEELFVDEGIAVNGDEPMLGEPLVVQAEETEGILTAQASYAQPANHSQDEIISFIKNHPFDVLAPDTYDVDPVTTAPYAAGQLSAQSTQNALNMLNTLRYIAGVGYYVTNNSSYQRYSQAAALVNMANGSLSHYPVQPSGMDAQLYQTGYTGSGNSNIASGSENAASAILQYFDDQGSNNSGVVGHRRWLSSSRLGQVGIGQVDFYNATYINDSSDPSYVTDVAWPARQMPTCLFSTGNQWSFATITQDIGRASSISVRVVRRRDGKVWNLSPSDITVNEVSEYSSFVGYDKNGCIVWDLYGVEAYADGDVFDVTISGDVSSKSYTVEFFDIISVDTVTISGPDGASVSADSPYTVTTDDDDMQFLFFPSISDAAYPTDPTLQSLAAKYVGDTTISYTSSNENVATVTASGPHDISFSMGGDWIPLDWAASVKVVGAGTTTITATLSNGMTASFDLVVIHKNIDPSVDSHVIIMANNETFTYNGSAQHPTYYVYYRHGYNTLRLIEGTNYTISYSNNTNAGTGTATIRGIGEYEGVTERSFTINPASLSSASIVSIPGQTYTGSAIAPSLTVTLGGRALVPDTDYTVSYSDNVTVGTATVTVTGKGNYAGTKSATFTINRASLSTADIAAIPNQTYTGSAVAPSLTVTLGGRTLKSGTDYTVSYSNNVNAGTATATVTGKGNFTGTKSTTFTINRASLSSADIAAIPDQTYTGSAIAPSLTVTLGGRTLVSGTDYTVSYSSNVNAGTATVTVTGKGNYAGTKSTTFEIAKASLSKATIDAITAQTYTGSAIAPSLTVTLSGRTLVPGTDYTVAYSDNVAVGTATVTVTGKGGYTGTKTATFEIARASLAKATVAAIPDLYYLEEAREPSPVVTLGGRTLRGGTDYTVAYSDNVAVGTAKVTVTGKGSYAGTKTATFKITIPFVDVTMKTGHAGDIGWLAEGKISEGWTLKDGTREFRPLANVARADMAAFLFRLAKSWGIVDDSWKPSGSVTFLDVNEGTPHYREVMWLAESGVSEGWPVAGGREFRPYASVARADMAAFLFRLAKARGVVDESWQPSPGSASFLDVTGKTPHYREVMWLASTRVSEGWPVSGGREFRPYDNVARSDMAAFLRRLDGLG